MKETYASYERKINQEMKEEIFTMTKMGLNLGISVTFKVAITVSALAILFHNILIYMYDFVPVIDVAF